MERNEAAYAAYTRPDDLDEYQALAASTAIYPRVYTEEQVHNMLLRAYVRTGSWSQEEVEEFVCYDLDREETPFNRLVYPVLGLVGEAGEIANKLKKVARDNQGHMDLDQSVEIAKETGDVLWYVAAVATELKAKLGVIANDNINKLFSRRSRGVIGGSGDNR